ncbi:MAG: bifunctional oligoribonuclease/PAP phosphatase NrnA [Tissierellales bacterium]|nr:bifunctional oligoribonuclease/PAP phosphatase NrnA [Tissierellales bacterium]
MINSKNLKKLDEFVEKSNKIAVAAHADPDGDIIVSIMALREILKTKGKDIDFFINGEIPFNYKFIKDLDKASLSYKEKKYDLFFALDSSDEERLADKVDIMKNSKKTICIDHHKTNKGYCNLNIIEPDFSSTGEIIYEIFKTLKYEINERAAENIFIAIITDTGKFIYDNAGYKTFENVSDLLKLNINKNEIVKNLYSSEPKNIFKLKADVFNSTEFFMEDKVALSCLFKENLKKYNLSLKDIDGLVERLRDIENVEISILIKELDDKTYKISMRSLGNSDVSKVCETFGGGGHKNAAGFKIDNIEFATLKKLILEEVEKNAL